MTNDEWIEPPDRKTIEEQSKKIKQIRKQLHQKDMLNIPVSKKTIKNVQINFLTGDSLIVDRDLSIEMLEHAFGDDKDEI